MKDVAVKKIAYLWNNKDTHDKVYAVANLDDGRLVKVWGRRGKRLNCKIEERPGFGLFQETLSEKENRKGYDRVIGVNPVEAAIIRSINEVIDVMVLDGSPATSKPIEKHPEKAPEVLLVRCLDNVGYEEHFELGIEYPLLRKGEKLLSVENRLGEAVDVREERFEIIKAEV